MNPPNENDLKTKSVLLIDDDDSIRSAMFHLLKKKTKAFLALETAEEGLKTLQKGLWDIILCDYQLPGMNGIDFFKKMASRSSDYKKILITGHADPSLAIRATRAGIDAFIPKPLNSQNILSILNFVLHKGPTDTSPSQPHWEEETEWVIFKACHQNNNLLQALLGNIQLGMLEAGDKPAVISRLNHIAQVLDKLDRTNGELMLFGKSIKEPLESIVLNELIRTCLQPYNSMISSLNIRCIFDPRTPPVSVRTRRSALTQILDNVIINAVQALSEIIKEDKTLHIRLEKLDDLSRISVSDNGCGMDSDALANIYQKGFTTKKTGAGIGMFLARKFCEDIGAAIDVHSNVNHGTTVSIDINH